MPIQTFPALRYLASSDTGRLFPEEHAELTQALASLDGGIACACQPPVIRCQFHADLTTVAK